MEQIRLLHKEEIETRIGTISEKGLSLLLYKDARADMKILDETYGPLNWQRRHEVVGGSLYCTVSIWDQQKGQWISKMDVGTVSYAEKEKGQASDSFKRACVSLGIGRELYTAPFIWIPASKTNIQKRNDRYFTYDKFKVQEISYNENREIAGLVIMNQDGKVVYALRENADSKAAQPENASSVPAGMTDGKDGTRKKSSDTLMPQEKVEAINKELERTGVALDAVLKRYGVGTIQEMSAATYRSAMNSLKKTKDKGKAA